MLKKLEGRELLYKFWTARIILFCYCILFLISSIIVCKGITVYYSYFPSLPLGTEHSDIFLSFPSLLLNQTKQGDLSFELNALLINLHASLLFHGYLVSGYLLYTYWQVYSGLQSLHMNNHIIWALRICIICFLDFVLFVYMIFLGKMKIWLVYIKNAYKILSINITKLVVAIYLMLV